MKSALDIKLVAEPVKLSISERAAFKVGIEAVNRGSAPVDPHLHDAVLTCNGERAYAWDLAIQNGIHDASWTRLEPGKAIAASWSLGDALFDKPGIYQLALVFDDQTSTATVEITP